MKSTRRDFMKTNGILLAGTTLAGSLSVGRSAHAAGGDLIRAALIGCGGRGSGAMINRLNVGDNVQFVAVADAFTDRAKGLIGRMNKEEKYKSKVDVPEERIFGGFDAYKKAIDCLKPGDQVLIATPPGFRPYHYRYAVEKGLHVFMEKPLFTDAPGFRHTMETNKKADEKNLKICVGLQRRHDDGFRQWVDQISDGTIGDISYSRVFWNGSGIWCNGRNRNETEMEYQLRNWYHFVWLCGDNICEQHVHNLDMGLWMHGKGDPMVHPVEANAQGGRQNPAIDWNILCKAPDYADKDAWWAWYEPIKGDCKRYGQAWDHFFVEYVFSDGSRMFSQCRHIANSFNDVSQYVYGTKGYGGAEGSAGRNGWLNDRAGKELYKVRINANQFDLEHVNHVKAIRENTPMNNGWYGANSTMTAVLGRMAAYSGKIISWDDAVDKGSRYMPEGGPASWDETPPVVPDKDGFYESTVPKQGLYNPFA